MPNKNDIDLMDSMISDPEKEPIDIRPIGEDNLQSHIYTIRGVQVMLDGDLAQLYGVETKRLNEAVKRNRERFPDRFMFQLAGDELDCLRSQIATLNNVHQFKESKNCRGQHTKYLPYVFTEQGITQLSSVLRSKVAIEVSIRIMDAFVALRRFLSSNALLFQRIDRIESCQVLTDKKMEMVLRRMDELAPTISPEQIFATGCVWDAWSYVSQLVRSANKRIVLVDNFVDDKVLTLLTKRKCKVEATIFSRYTVQLQLDLEKHNTQYDVVTFIQIPHKSHDRFLIIDDVVCLLGASVKDMGTSLCALTRMELSPEIVLNLLK